MKQQKVICYLLFVTLLLFAVFNLRKEGANDFIYIIIYIKLIRYILYNYIMISYSPFFPLHFSSPREHKKMGKNNKVTNNKVTKSQSFSSIFTADINQVNARKS